MYIDRCKFMAEVTRQNMTFGELCEKSGFSYTVMTKLRKNGGPCAEETLRKICDALGIRIVDLLDDETAWSAYNAKLQEAEAIRPRTMPVKPSPTEFGHIPVNPIKDIKIST